MLKPALHFALAVTVVCLFAAQAATADNPPKTDAAVSSHAPSLFRVSTIEGLKVRNAAGEDLGKIKDIVIDLHTGKVTYAALDFGGFLGVGDKLFAVPWQAFKVQSDGKHDELILDASKERLKNAPGFDKSHWPNMADPQWSSDVDKFYGTPRTARREAKPAAP